MAPNDASMVEMKEDLKERPSNVSEPNQKQIRTNKPNGMLKQITDDFTHGIIKNYQSEI